MEVRSVQWKFEGSSPVYLQIMEHIRRAVLSGEYPPGARIPAVRDLAAQARVNPNTMQRALSQLEQEKLLIACGTTGRFVTDDKDILDAMRQKQIDAVVQSCAKQLKAMGLSMQEATARLLALDEKEEA